MHRRRRLLAGVCVVLAVTACSQAQDAADDAASSAADRAAAAASQAASRAAGAAVDQVRGQICDRIADGQVSAQDQQVLSGLADAARQAGVPEQISGPLGEIAADGDQVPADTLQRLQDACAS